MVQELKIVTKFETSFVSFQQDSLKVSKYFEKESF